MEDEDKEEKEDEDKEEKEDEDKEEKEDEDKVDTTEKITQEEGEEDRIQETDKFLVSPDRKNVWKKNNCAKKLLLTNEDKLKELSSCHKLKFFNHYFFATWWCKILIFQTKINWYNTIHS